MRVLALFLILAAEVFGQANVDIKPCAPKSKVLADGSVQVTDCNGQVKTIPPQPDPQPVVKSSAQASQPTSYDRYMDAMYDYYTYQFEEAKRVYTWQYYSSIVIFFVVLVLVFAGLVFAGMQFQHGLHAKRKVANAQAAELSTIEASLSGIKVSSSTLGVLVLVISMCFFYLYLYFVYPINNVHQTEPRATQSADEKPKP